MKRFPDMFMKSFIRNISLLVASSLLAGCGGSGTNGGGSYTDVVSFFEKTLVQQDHLTTGQPSNNLRDDGYGYGTVKFLGGNLRWGSCVYYCTAAHYSRSETISAQLFPNNHINDTQASAAWADGWTGAGQTIAIIDDFSNKDIQTASRIEITRRHYKIGSVRPGQRADNANYSHTFEYDLVKLESHGELVSSIAGGGGTANAVSESASVIAQDCLEDCGTLPENSGSASRSDPVWNSLAAFSNSAAPLEYLDQAGIAKDAFVVKQDVDLSGITSISETFRRIASHIDNSSEFSAINLSLGMNIPTSNVTYSQIIRDMSSLSLENNSNAVVVVSAGNSGAPCRESNLAGCNAVAVALTANEKINQNLLIVGATTGSGLNETIANYSTRPGFLKSRFIFANGDSGYYEIGSNTKIQGTSFAAPRVTGAAAILRQKFPNLTGSEAATIILETASKDINGDGISDFTGVSDTFGNGKLDLTSALQPIGKLRLE